MCVGGGGQGAGGPLSFLFPGKNTAVAETEQDGARGLRCQGKWLFKQELKVYVKLVNNF